MPCEQFLNSLILQFSEGGLKKSRTKKSLLWPNFLRGRQTFEKTRQKIFTKKSLFFGARFGSVRVPHPPRKTTKQSCSYIVNTAFCMLEIL